MTFTFCSKVPRSYLRLQFREIFWHAPCAQVLVHEVHLLLEGRLRDVQLRLEVGDLRQQSPHTPVSRSRPSTTSREIHVVHLRPILEVLATVREAERVQGFRVVTGTGMDAGQQRRVRVAAEGLLENSWEGGEDMLIHLLLLHWARAESKKKQHGLPADVGGRQ